MFHDTVAFPSTTKEASAAATSSADFSASSFAPVHAGMHVFTESEGAGVLLKLIVENSGSLGALACAMSAWGAEHADVMQAPLTGETEERIREATKLVAEIRAQQKAEWEAKRPQSAPYARQ
jgi:hypothetical protein